MTGVAVLLAAAVVGACLLALFVHWERQSQEHRPVALILALLAVELVLYDNQENMPRGIFHPGVGSLDVRLPEVLICLALVARLVARGRPRSIGLPALLWAAVAAWFAVAVAIGVVSHNSRTLLPYEAKTVVYIVGGYALASGVPVRRFLEARMFERLARWSSLGAVVLILMTMAGRSEALNIPLLTMPEFGALGGDTATFFVAVGIVALMLELGKDRRSTLTLASACVLLLASFFAGQRASLLMLGGAVATVLVAAMGRTARTRINVSGIQVVLVALAVVGVVLTAAVVPALVSQQSVKVPLASRTVSVFDTTAKAESAQARLNKWSVAWDAIAEDPMFGHGLGYQYTYFDPGPNQLVTTDITENLFLDLLLWTGVVGLVLFVAALLVSLVDGLRAWWFHPDAAVGVLALAMVAVVVGFVAKGQVESLFEKYREATAMGIALGVLRSAVTSTGGLRRQRTFASKGWL
ncbi:MAG TPA: O-antigen ligase family protein [Acidimicrobiales bacterium]|nr:O-antigen ligase family protein [Acidimicrobiales bacterium]